ncbi:hypothetical protein [Streptomyces sp. NPDC001880]
MPKLASSTNSVIGSPQSPADIAANEAASSYERPVPTVDVAELLTATAALLLERPARILTHTDLTATVLAAAGSQASTVALCPAWEGWEALPLHREGDEHWEYAARLILAAKTLTTHQQGR